MSEPAQHRPEAVPYPWSAVDGQKPRKRIWVPHVDSELRSLWIRVDMAVARERSAAEVARAPGRELTGPPESLSEHSVLANGVRDLITRAVRAAYRRDPVPGRLLNWWRGALVEQAYRNLHGARAQMVDLMTEHELNAEIPGVVARVHSTLRADDPRRVSQHDLDTLALEPRRAWVRRLMEDSYEALDMQHARLRSFRNIVLISAAVVIVLMSLTVAYISSNPSFVPLCFPAETATAGATPGAASPDEDGDESINCPTGNGVTEPTSADVVVIALIGLLGGTLAATVSIRKVSGATGPYDVPVALAWLKIPLGAFTAVLGIVAVRGGFVPGLTDLDSQDQILAYALLFGFAQQLFTTFLDKRATELVDALPTKESQGGGSESRSVHFQSPAGPVAPTTIAPDGPSAITTPGPTTTDASRPHPAL